ncbi:MAG: ATP cone domain-containing protein [Methanobacterium sp.]
MRNVVKRKGEVEPYDPNKIKGALQKATIDAGYSLEEKNELIDEIYDKINKKFEKEGEIKSENIRACLLTELDECEPYIAKSWRNFDKKYKL